MWKKITKKINNLTPAQLIVTFYILAVTVSVLLLSLPIAHKDGVHIPFIDRLFTAASAISVTGLTVISIKDTFSTAGIFILIFVLQVGGIGVMTLGTFIWLVFGRKIGLRERKLIMVDQNQSQLSGLVNLLKQILVIFILIEVFGSIILGIYFLDYFPTWEEAFIHGIFASASATTNAGFDITGQSLVPYANDYFVQFITMILIILGAIGFPVLVELKEFIMNKKGRYRFSLFAKLTTVTFFSLVILGTLFIFMLEWNHFFKRMAWHETFFYSLFQSVTTRSAGLATMDVNEFSSPTQLLLSGMMFIGASPSSVGGGIRTTTFALNLLFLYHFARGNRSIKIFKREIHEEDIIKSCVVTLFAFFICFVAVIMLSITEDFSLMQILFEVCSAFGTTGLSMGITPDLTEIGKIIIILLMFIGRVGILSFLFLIGKKGMEPDYHYPKERLIIG
ncbi:TrkH family potassium uptake protein [Ferdinandcohnia quinoae]|uniref:TrkH family potassium uptake protein n=1 Tax=Fredinandcohnia quinoae TaxID=2918902 RepID=A0AAW5E3Q0_9BACI|nr:TrkH family potassium uptake protein [Fredinandcohnia sp. SECRCQ15]MCH1627555.1 TrkH family potassium uptake protein [Fredinandcohnia sp. SECRCQ15]